MDPPIFKIPDELLLKILAFVMSSDDPVHFATIISDHRVSPPRERDGNYPYCELPYCVPLASGYRQTECVCEQRQEFLQSQQNHFDDWRIANSVSSRFKLLAKESFFANKTFCISTPELKRLHTKENDRLSDSTVDMFFNHTRNIIVTMEFRGDDPNYVSAPQYSGFERLKTLTIWPGARWNHFPDFEIARGGMGLASVEYSRLSGGLRRYLDGFEVDKEDLCIGIFRASGGVGWLRSYQELHDVVLLHIRYVSEQRRKLGTKPKQVV